MPLSSYSGIRRLLESPDGAAGQHSCARSSQALGSGMQRAAFLDATAKLAVCAACCCCRATVRELSSTSDTAAQFGKLADELNHVRAKEGLARSALNRSEMERVELERQTRSLKQQVASLTVQLSLAQDQAR